jgi:uncharacterized cupredoxin-like copper-binding protein
MQEGVTTVTTRIGLCILGTALVLAAPSHGGGSTRGIAEPDDARASSTQTIKVITTDSTLWPRTVTITASGTYLFRVTNRGRYDRALHLRGPGVARATRKVRPGASTELLVDVADPGRYQLSG